MEMTNEIICRVMAPYYKQSLLICEPNTEPLEHYLEGVDYIHNEIIAERVHYNPHWIKLILRPLSDITDSDAHHVAEMIGTEGDDLKLAVEQKEDLVEILLDTERERRESNLSVLDEFFIYQYLQSQGYDIPSFLLGGKTLFQAGLAIYKK